MAQVAPATELSPPPLLPAAGGLLPTLRALDLVVDHTEDSRPDTYWQAGFWHWPLGCGDVSSWAPCPDPDTVEPKTPTAQPAIPSFQPWEVLADDTCGSTGVTGDYDLERRRARAREKLDRKASNAIAAEMWRGTLATANTWDSPTFAADAELLTSIGNSSPYGLALGTLQQALADCLGDGVAGMIHAPRRLVNAWWSSGSIYQRPDSPVIYDVFGNVIVSSGGYTGSAPDGVVTATQPWAYATGAVVVHLGPVHDLPDELVQAVDRGVNNITTFAERVVAYQFDTCCLFGIATNLCCQNCSEAGS